MIGAFIQFNTDSRFAKSAPIGYIITERGCWEWVGAISPVTGYVHLGKTTQRSYCLAHRYFYEQRYGPIPDGLVLDHLCRVRHCVNPDHLRVVTQRENILSGNGACANFYRRTHCKEGHALVPDPKRGRTCHVCTKVRAHRNYMARSEGKVTGRRPRHSTSQLIAQHHPSSQCE